LKNGIDRWQTNHQIKISSQHNIDFLATGGGHGASVTYNKFRSGIEIDLQNFNSVHLDVDRQLLTVGGGTVFSDIIEPLYAAKQELCECWRCCIHNVDKQRRKEIFLM
jgi:FAD/FMN-containing dehydrogenase